MEVEWFTDIDGVMNVFPKCHDPKNRGPHLKHWKNWEQTVIDGYPILFAHDMIEAMNTIGENANISMLTTWYETSVSFFNPGTGLNSSTHIPRRIGLDYPLTANQANPNKEAEWWKLNAVKEHMEAKGTPFVWTDDQINGSIRRYVQKVAQDMSIPCLLITPYPNIGLEKKHLDKVDEFVAFHSAS